MQGDAETSIRHTRSRRASWLQLSGSSRTQTAWVQILPCYLPAVQPWASCFTSLVRGSFLER